LIITLDYICIVVITKLFPIPFKTTILFILVPESLSDTNSLRTFGSRNIKTG